MEWSNVCVDWKRMFAAGMAYVAISRCKSLDGLWIINFNGDVGLHKYDDKIIEFERTLITTAASQSAARYSNVHSFAVETQRCQSPLS